MDLDKIPAHSKVRVTVEGYKTPFSPGATGIKLRDHKDYSHSTASLWVPWNFLTEAEVLEELVPDSVYRDANGVYWQLSYNGEMFYTFGTSGAYALDVPLRPLEKMS